MIRVTVWNEFVHEREEGRPKELYPDGIHGCIAAFLSKEKDMIVRTAVLGEDMDGLSEEVLAETDVLVWWGHCAHDRVSDDTVERVIRHINGGMGFIALHSAHHSKVFRRLCGTTCNLSWKNDDREVVNCCAPFHPIAKGVPASFVIEPEEMYAEPFDIPETSELIFIGSFADSSVIRSGFTLTRGGKIFYFQPGHEDYPTYYNENVRRIITNAVRFTCPVSGKHCVIPVVNRI